MNNFALKAIKNVQQVRIYHFRGKYPEISYGGSPRASLALLKTSKVLAAMQGRDFVLPEDVKQMAYAVLRHRIILSYHAMAEGITSDDLIERILANVRIG